MDPQLVFHNVVFLLGGIVNVGVAILVFFSTRQNRNVTATTFALSSLAVAVFQFSHLLGTNAPDAETSRFILMFNLTDIFIGMFMTHWFLGFIGRDRELRIPLFAVYISGLAIFAACLAWPTGFLVDSVPKLYFPFYYEPGPLYYIMFTWFLIVSVFHFSQLIIAYRREGNEIQKKRYKYVLYAMIWAYIFGTTAFLLVFDIPFNPALSALFGFYPIMIVYTILQYEVFSVRIFAKRAFIYAAIIILCGALLTLSDALSGYLVGFTPNFPSWVSSGLVSVLLGGGAIYVWRRTREADVATYEFITIVTHKFRTPLTRIRWATEEIAKLIPPEKTELAETVFKSQRQLLELTDTLVQLSNRDTSTLTYRLATVNFLEFFSTISPEYAEGMKKKNISLSMDIPADFTVVTDREKLNFVFEVLLNNAINYTPEGGSISITTSVNEAGTRGIIAVRDSGIGMSKDTLAHQFTRFYRGEKARLADTEGMGIGLYMARNIVQKQSGKMWANSAGEGKGSAFFVELPLMKM